MAEEKKETALERLENFIIKETLSKSLSVELLSTLREVIVEHENKIHVMQGDIEDMTLQLRTLTNQLGRL